MSERRSVTMNQLTEWLETNKFRTWQFENFGEDHATLEIKYLRFNLDTRDMKIFRISIDGIGEDKAVDFRDKFDGNILDQLSSMLKPQEKKP